MELAIVQIKSELATALQVLREGGRRVALVPTMGALHDGHISLINQAKKHADAVVASIFVNPRQFGPSEDFEKYPRTLNADIALLKQAGVDLLYAPDAADMYENNASTSIRVAGAGEGLCAAARPGHFDGVALVVAKLLLRVLPDVAIFGEKDFQQLSVIKRMVADLDIPVEILSAPIVREADGLAMSSRNRYLHEKERKIAPLLYKTLHETAEYLTQHPYNVDNAVSLAIYNLSHHGFDKVDYVELRAEDSLRRLPVLNRPARLLAAVWLGDTRLIDNVAVEV